MSDPLRVLIVDDAAFMRRSLTKLMSDATQVDVVGEAVNGREGFASFERLRPDVVCLDIDMPEMNGITALKHMMSVRPTPVIIVSSLTDRDNVPFEAVRLGVIDFFPKPSSLSGAVQDQTRLLLYLVRSARWVRLANLRRVPLVPRQAASGDGAPCRHLVAVGGTLGSTSGLIRLLSLLPSGQEEGVSILCKVPIHAAVRRSFGESVERFLGWQVSEPQSRDRLRAGVVYFTPLDSSARFEGDEVVFEPESELGLDQDFAAVGERFGKSSSTILLAGDQTHGLTGLAEAAAAGSSCFVQDERSALFSTWTPHVADSIPLMDLEAVADRVRARLAVGPPADGGRR